jgi:hypothetical protein
MKKAIRSLLTAAIAIILLFQVVGAAMVNPMPCCPEDHCQEKNPCCYLFNSSGSCASCGAALSSARSSFKNQQKTKNIFWLSHKNNFSSLDIHYVWRPPIIS